MKKTILIDGDILVYSIAYSVQSPIYVVKNTVYKSKKRAEVMAKKLKMPFSNMNCRRNIGSIEQLKRNLSEKMNSIQEDLETKDYKMYITASKVKENFRSQVSTILPYKGNRMDIDKPFYYDKMREILVDEWGAILVKGQEADDAISIEQFKIFAETKSFDETYIATIDKDLRAIPGNHYHLKNRTIEMVDQEQALKNFYLQLIKGDFTDNIPGVARLLKLDDRINDYNKLVYGRYVKKAENKFLEFSLKQCYDYVSELYTRHGYEDKHIGEIGNLLWLRRYENQNWWEDHKQGKIHT